MGAGPAQLVLAALVALACLPEQTRALHVLVVFPVGSGSHRNLGQAIARGLHARGHRVTLVSPFPRQQPLHNWTDVAIPNTIHFFGQTSGFFELGSLNNFKKFKKMSDYGIASCEVYLKDENVKRLMNSNEKFDVMIIEIFFCECLLPLAHRFKIPVIQFNTFWPGAWVGDKVGSPSPYAYVPDTFLAYTDHMTFFQRLHNAVFGLYCKIIHEMYLLPTQDELVRRHVDDPTLPSLSELDRSSSVLLTNSHVSLQYPRPLAPALVEVGGMHVNPPKKLPKDLQEYLDDAKDGAIYFSLGSNLRSADLPEETRQAIVNAFSKLKQRVLWKWEAETLPGKPDNLKLGKWLPQSDILAHKNIRLFITHGGFLSTLETVYHGVPVIGIPVFSDQDLNMIQAEDKGYGIRLRLNNITSETFYWAITEILNNPKYQIKAKELSRLYHDRPRTPMEEVVYWTEYVARHKGASHMRSAALDLSWYQFWNVVAYATAEEYELEKLREGLIRQDLYEVRPLGDATDTSQAEPDVLQVTARYTVDTEPRDIYFFREGTTVFWNISELECTNVLSFVKQYEENSYDERLVQQESELMEYTYVDAGNSRLGSGNLCLASKGTTYLDKYTFSNAMALSVKLGIWEASLSRYVDTIEFVNEDMKQGRKIRMSRKEVLRKTGELFALRHLINLSSDLLDTPDFYWDRETQEALYQQMCSYFSISRRTRVMNEKLNHCFELVELLSSHLNDQHHIRLEWMIIALIMIEVVFEILHYIEKFS